MMNKIFGVISVAATMALASQATAAVQVLSFSGTLSSNSNTKTANVFGYPAANTFLTNQAFSVTLSYDLTQFAGTGGCGMAANASCTWTLSNTKSIFQAITVNGVTRNYVLTSGNYSLNASGNDAFNFSISGSQVANLSGNFTATNANMNAFFPNQGAVNSAAFNNFSGLAVQNVSFTENTDQFYAEAKTGSITALTASNSVPEPSSWAMMLVGFGALGLALRRQSNAKVFRFA